VGHKLSQGITRLGRWLDPVGTLEEQAEQQREGR
jgi:hypothetical protein